MTTHTTPTPDRPLEIEEITFDGIYRPEMFGRTCYAVAYVNRDGQGFRSTHGEWRGLQMKPVQFRSVEEAQAKCDELNTRLLEKAQG